MLSGAGRGLSLTRRTARKLPVEAEVLEIDVTEPGQLATAAGRARTALGPARRPAARHRLRPARVPGRGHLPGRLGPGPGRPSCVHVLAQGPRRGVPSAPGGCRRSMAGPVRRSSASTSTPPWPGRSTTGWACPRRRSSHWPVTWPGTSASERIRVNLVAAGPVKTMAAKSIPGFTAFEDTWGERAPLGWDVFDTDVVARACVALLSRPPADDHRRDPARRRRRPRHGSLTWHPTPDSLRAAVAHYVATVNGRDPAAIAALFTEDAVQADPASQPGQCRT